MTNRPKRPPFAAGIALALIATSLTSETILPPATLRAKEPLTAAALCRPIRPAVVPRNVEEVGYFQPLARPPQVHVVLDRVVEFDVDDMPMDYFFLGLERLTGVPFVLDESGLNEAAVTSDVEITARSAGMPLGVALAVLLRDLDLACVVEDGYVLITSREITDYEIETRLYAFADHPLLDDAERYFLADAIRLQAAGENWHGQDYNHVSVLPGAIAVTGRRRPQERTAAFLRQYGRLLAEYDVAATPTGEPPGDEPPAAEEEYVTVVRAKTPRDESAYFRLLTDRPRTAAFLDGPASFDAEDMPIRKLFAKLESDLGIRFELDEAELELEEATPDFEVTLRAQGLTHADALSLALRGQNLKVVPLDDRVVVTSRDDERFLIETRSYAIGDHALLQGENAERFLRELRVHVIDEDRRVPEGCEIRLEEGTLSIRASAEMLDRAEGILRQYARLLAEFDAKDPRSTEDPIVGAAATSDGDPTPEPCFRCLTQRPWTAAALQKPATIDVVERPLEEIVLQAEQACGVPFLLDAYGLEEAAITSDAELTFRAASEETYADALARMLGEHDLAYLARERYIWITSREAAEEREETRLYAIHAPPVLDERAGGLRGAIEQHLDAADPTHDWPALIHLLPGALVVTEDPRKLALVEEFLAKQGLAPPDYAEKPASPPGPAPKLEP